MIGELLRRLSGARPQDEGLPELTAPLAVGALMVRLAKSDAEYALEEIRSIDALLTARYGLNPLEAAKMRATCERLEAAAPETGAFTAMVQQSVNYGERTRIYDALWQVSMADAALKPQEQALLDDLARVLGVTPEDAAAIAARHRTG